MRHEGWAAADDADLRLLGVGAHASDAEVTRAFRRKIGRASCRERV